MGEAQSKTEITLPETKDQIVHMRKLYIISLTHTHNLYIIKHRKLIMYGG